MRFHAVHKLMSYLLAASAVGTLLTSGALPLSTLLLLLVVGTLSWFVEPGTRFGVLLDRAGLVFNVGALAFFGLSLYQVVRSFPEPDLTPILNLVIFLLAYKLFHRRSNRDYLQLYILSFMLIVAGAWLGQSVLFVVGFATYVVLATWTLILFHLRREIEDNYLVKHSPEAGAEKVTAARVLNSRRVVGRRFFLATGGMALVVFIGSALVFAAIPRIGIGFLLGGVRRRVNLVGFSDEVMLGQHGVLSSNNETVVLRAQVRSIAALPDDGAREDAISLLYWRGTVYDLYHQGGWLRSRAEQTETLAEEHLLGGGESLSILRPKIEITARTNANAASRRRAVQLEDEQEIWVEGLSHPVAFALDQPLAFKTPAPPLGSLVRTEVLPRHSGEVGLRLKLVSMRGSSQPRLDFKGARYFAYSRDTLRSARMIHRPLDKLPPGAMEPYLRAPSSLSPRVLELARAITAGKERPVEKMAAIVEWLRKTHGYTTDLKRNPSIPDPLEDFLFHQQAGHCEYFASAAAILLRLSGVPTRYVNGFLGGEWNGITKQITIRDNRAHSWVEAYLGATGWVRVDATPVSLASSRMSRLRQIFDSVELFWSRWVMDYDVSRQVDIARSIGKRLGFERDPGAKKASWAWLGWTAFGLALVGAGTWAWRRQRRGWRRTRTRYSGGGLAPTAPIARLWAATLERLGRHGFPRRPDETPREYARRLGAASVPGADLIARLAAHYGAARYGEREIADATVQELRQALEAVALPAPGAPMTEKPPEVRAGA